MKRLLFSLATLFALSGAALAAPLNNAKPVGGGISAICQTSAPAPINTARIWVLCSNGHVMSSSASNADTDLSAAAAGSGYSLLQQGGVSLTARTVVNFTGAGVSCVDNSGATRTDCTISGGGSATPSVITWKQTTAWSTILASIPAGGAIIQLVDDGSANSWTLNQSSGDLSNVWFVGTKGPPDGFVSISSPITIHVATGWSTTGKTMNFRNVNVSADSATLMTATSSSPVTLSIEGGTLTSNSASFPVLAISTSGLASLALGSSAAIQGSVPAVVLATSASVDIQMTGHAAIYNSAMVAPASGATSTTTNFSSDSTCFIAAGAVTTASTTIGTSGTLVKRVADANYSVRYADAAVEYTSLTAARVVTLPAAANQYGMPPITIRDASGSCNGTRTITVQSVSGTIDGVAAGTGFPLNTAYQSITYVSDNINWISTASCTGGTASCTSGGGGGAVSSVSNSDSTLTISPTTGSVVASLNLGHANTWSAAQTYQSGTLLVDNSANTFATTLATSATAARTVTIPDQTFTVPTGPLYIAETGAGPNTISATAATSTTIRHTTLSASSVDTLPAASSVAGQAFTIQDGTGNCSPTVTITVKSASGTLDSVAASTGLVLSSARSSVTVVSDGTNYNSTSASFAAFNDAADTATASTTSASFVDTGDNGVTTGYTTWTFTAPRTGMYAVTYSAGAYVTTGATPAIFQLVIDGSAPAQPTKTPFYYSTAAVSPYVVVVPFSTPLTAGSHTFKIQWKADGTHAINTNIGRSFSVQAI